MQIQTLTIGMFQAHAYVVMDEATRRAAIIDTGEDGRGIETVVKRMGAEPVMVLLTHAHIDHAGGLAAVRRAFPGIPIRLHEADRPWVENLARQGAMFGLPVEEAPPVDGGFTDGEVVEVAPDLRFRVIHTPGHSEGSVTFFDEKTRRAFVGDTLFQRSIGRTDLPGGSAKVLLRTLKERLATLGDDVTCYPGHGPHTTIGAEKRHNPFLQPGIESRIDDMLE